MDAYDAMRISQMEKHAKHQDAIIESLRGEIARASIFRPKMPTIHRNESIQREYDALLERIRKLEGEAQ